MRTFGEFFPREERFDFNLKSSFKGKKLGAGINTRIFSDPQDGQSKRSLNFRGRMLGARSHM